MKDCVFPSPCWFASRAMGASTAACVISARTSLALASPQVRDMAILYCSKTCILGKGVYDLTNKIVNTALSQSAMHSNACCQVSTEWADMFGRCGSTSSRRLAKRSAFSSAHNASAPRALPANVAVGVEESSATQQTFEHLVDCMGKSGTTAATCKSAVRNGQYGSYSRPSHTALG